MEYNYFYSLTPRVFVNILSGYRKKEEQNFINKWEQTRDIEFALVNLFADSKLNLTKQRYKPFPWDKEQNAKPKPTKEQIKNTFAKWDNITFKKK